MTKKQKRNLIYIVVAFVIVGSVSLIMNYSYFNVQSCTADLELNLTKPRIVLGEIILKFKSDINEMEAKSIIDSYGLESRIIDISSDTPTFIAYVSDGKEAEWICQFMIMHDKELEDAYPQYNEFNEEIEECIKQMNYYPTNPTEEQRYNRHPGEIILRLYSNVSNEELQLVYDKYGLSGHFERGIITPSSRTNVPLGSESQWICQLEVFHNNIVEDAYPAWIGHPMEGG